jgi:hypothetical protein
VALPLNEDERAASAATRFNSTIKSLWDRHDSPEIFTTIPLHHSQSISRF